MPSPAAALVELVIVTSLLVHARKLPVSPQLGGLFQHLLFESAVFEEEGQPSAQAFGHQSFLDEMPCCFSTIDPCIRNASSRNNRQTIEGDSLTGFDASAFFVAQRLGLDASA